MGKTVNISERNHERLSKLGKYGQSMDDIIERLLDHYEQAEQMRL